MQSERDVMTASPAAAAGALGASGAGWIANELLHGERPEQIVDRLCVAGVPRGSASREVQAALDDPYLDAALLRARHARKAAALLELQYTMWRRSEESKRITEVSDLDPQRFAEEFYFANRPFVLRKGAADWPAVRKWSPAFFRDAYGSVVVEYNRGADRYAHPSARLEKTSIREFVDRVESTVASNDFYLTATSNMLAAGAPLASLAEDVGPLPFAQDERTNRSRALNLWFGPRGTVTPLHHDLMNIVFVQVFGTKEFILAPSFCLTLLHNRRGVYSELDPVAMGEDRLPMRCDIRWLRFTVDPGDVVFLPVGWWHWVYASTTSISVSVSKLVVAGQSDQLRDFPGKLEMRGEFAAVEALG